MSWAAGLQRNWTDLCCNFRTRFFALVGSTPESAFFDLLYNVAKRRSAMCNRFSTRRRRPYVAGPKQLIIYGFETSLNGCFDHSDYRTVSPY
jgi:hypothetical protein